MGPSVSLDDLAVQHVIRAIFGQCGSIVDNVHRNSSTQPLIHESAIEPIQKLSRYPTVKLEGAGLGDGG
jgi:hypothetical protein